MAEKVIKVKVDKAGAQKDLDSINKTMKETGSNADSMAKSNASANKSLSNMIPIAKSAATGIAGVATAVAAGSAALVAFTRQNTLAIKEMEKSARMAGINTQAFQAYAYAANSVGISQEKLGDILKDVNDKVGDFVSTGGGEFADVFEKVLEPMGVTIDQLKEMSSTEVLVAVNKGLEDLGANGQEATFVLEAIANDAVLLQPLLEDNGKALKDLSQEARDMGLIISPDQVEAANDFNKAFEATAGKVDSFSQLLTAKMAPALTELVELAGDLVTYLAGAFNLTLESQIESINGKIEKQVELIEKLKKDGTSGNSYGALNNAPVETQIAIAESAIAGYRVELQALNADLSNTNSLTAVTITGGGGTNTGGTSVTGLGATNPDEEKANEEKLKRRSDYLNQWIAQTEEFNNTEQQNLDLWRDTQLTQLEEWYELNKDKKEQYEEALYNISAKWDDESTKLEDKRRQDSLDKDKKAQDERLAAFSAGQDALNSLADAAEGRSAKLNALVQGAAIFQASNNVILAASQALALPGDATVVQKMSSYALVATAGANLLSQFNSISEPSRQTGGYMMGGTPYQVGGGAHTTDPEMYTSGGKSYLIDSQAGMMTRVTGNSGTQSGQTGGVSVSINNYGQESTASVTDGGIDENGVRQMIIEMTPSIMAKEVNNASSPYRNAMSVNSKTQWDYS